MDKMISAKTNNSEGYKKRALSIILLFNNIHSKLVNYFF